jgi:hypothetical protein
MAVTLVVIREEAYPSVEPIPFPEIWKSGRQFAGMSYPSFLSSGSVRDGGTGRGNTTAALRDHAGVAAARRLGGPAPGGGAWPARVPLMGGAAGLSRPGRARSPVGADVTRRKPQRPVPQVTGGRTVRGRCPGAGRRRCPPWSRPEREPRHQSSRPRPGTRAAARPRPLPVPVPAVTCATAGSHREPAPVRRPQPLRRRQLSAATRLSGFSLVTSRSDGGPRPPRAREARRPARKMHPCPPERARHSGPGKPLPDQAAKRRRRQNHEVRL